MNVPADVRSLVIRISSVTDVTMELIILTLKYYKNIFGDLCVPLRYVVPWNDSDWPPVCWGFALGTTLTRLRSARERKITSLNLPPKTAKKRSPKWKVSSDSFPTDFERRLLDMGFFWDEKECKRNQLQQLLHIFDTLHNSTKIPATFIVPKESPWPRSCWEMRLGRLVHNIRIARRTYFGTNSTDLLPVSYQGRSKEQSFLLVYKALLTHKHIFGDLLVPRYFIVPKKDPWPPEVWGMKLGVRVNNIRTKSSYSDPVYHKLLNDIGFNMSLNDEL